MLPRFVRIERVFKWLLIALAFLFAIGASYGLGFASARDTCVTAGQFLHNDQIYRCERLR